MYINFWYPICTATELNEENPRRVEMLGVRLVAFRDESGKAHVLADTCIHRGGSLGKGKVKGDCVACPYHGWEFNGDGVCTKIPSMGDKKPPARAKVDSYPVQEKYGIIFAFLGDLPEAERPPLLEVDLLDDDNWRLSGPLVFEIDAYYQRSIENGMDPIHNEFVHPSQGAPAVNEERFSVTRQDWGCEFMVDFGELTDTESHDKVVERDTTGDLSAGSQHLGPNHLLTSINIPGGYCFKQYFYEAPISKGRTRIFFVNNRNNSLDAKLDDSMNGQFMKVAHEDRVVIEGLYPKRTPETLTKELMTAGDAAVVNYREYLSAWDKNGWAIDMKKMRETEGDVAYAIPCPARRESGNWILDTVPLLPASS